MSTVTYPALWFTSGSPISVGQHECAFERWLGYHAGQHGTGWRRKAASIPLATGAGVHDGIGAIYQWIIEWQAAHPGQRLVNVPDEVVAWAATEAASQYEHKARTRGLELTKTDLDAAAAVEQLILEQRTLIEAQVWIYAIVRLPIVLASMRVIASEHEEGPVLDCTCGLGNWVGQWTDHQDRGCAGIVMQGRADAILELIDGGTLVYEEIKTKATPNYGWENAWEHSSQLWINMEAASRRLGKEVSQAFVPVLYKGKRDRLDRDDKSSPRIQQSPLVYGWYDPGAPPMRPAEWSARHKWFDDWGKGHTLPRTFQRTPIWDPNTSLWASGDPPNGAIALTQNASRVEWWVKGWILPIQYPELLKVLGPFPKPAALMADAERSILAEEREWRSNVRLLRQLGLYEPSSTCPQYREGEWHEITTAADLIPRSWHCTKFDGSPCQFKWVCHREPGWEDIGASGLYEIRPPHHQIEKDAMTSVITSMGLNWPSEGDIDDGDN